MCNKLDIELRPQIPHEEVTVVFLTWTEGWKFDELANRTNALP
jgi:hypothetical protein